MTSDVPFSSACPFFQYFQFQQSFSFFLFSLEKMKMCKCLRPRENVVVAFTKSRVHLQKNVVLEFLHLFLLLNLDLIGFIKNYIWSINLNLGSMGSGIT